MTQDIHAAREPGLKAWFMRHAGRPLTNLFRQGLSPEKIALCLVLGVVFSLFPILGTTTLLCAAAAIAARVNMPAIQAVNWLMSAPHLAMIPVFLRIGERIAGAPPIPFQPAVWMQVFTDSPGAFVARFGGAALLAILGWAVTALPAAVLAYALLLRTLRRRGTQRADRGSEPRG